MPDEAEVLKYAFQINYQELIVSLIILAVAGIGIYMLVKKIQEILGV